MPRIHVFLSVLFLTSISAVALEKPIPMSLKERLAVEMSNRKLLKDMQAGKVSKVVDSLLAKTKNDRDRFFLKSLKSKKWKNQFVPAAVQNMLYFVGAKGTYMQMRFEPLPDKKGIRLTLNDRSQKDILKGESVIEAITSMIKEKSKSAQLDWLPKAEAEADPKLELVIVEDYLAVASLEYMQVDEKGTIPSLKTVLDLAGIRYQDLSCQDLSASVSYSFNDGNSGLIQTNWNVSYKNGQIRLWDLVENKNLYIKLASPQTSEVAVCSDPKIAAAHFSEQCLSSKNQFQIGKALIDCDAEQGVMETRIKIGCDFDQLPQSMATQYREMIFTEDESSSRAIGDHSAFLKQLIASKSQTEADRLMKQMDRFIAIDKIASDPDRKLTGKDLVSCKAKTCTFTDKAKAVLSGDDAVRLQALMGQFDNFWKAEASRLADFRNAIKYTVLAMEGLNNCCQDIRCRADLSTTARINLTDPPAPKGSGEN